jgi:hypothetical protein
MLEKARTAPPAGGHGSRVSDQLGGLIDPKHTRGPNGTQELDADFRRSGDPAPLGITSRTTKLAEQLLRDRERHRDSSRTVSTRPRAVGSDFDPFAVTRWHVIAGGNPGYLVKTPMRRGPVGWFIACGACAREFESKGLSYCPDCMNLPAEARRSERVSGGLPSHPEQGRSRLGPANEFSGVENGQKTQCLIDPQDFPINIVGGRRLPQEKSNPLGRVRVRPWV